MVKATFPQNGESDFYPKWGKRLFHKMGTATFPQNGKATFPQNGESDFSPKGLFPKQLFPK
jgi:hypothetical protein